MPIRCFWALAENINRIQAQDDIRQLSLLACAQSSEHAISYREKLVIEMGKVLEFAHTEESIRATQKFDRDGLNRLKASIKSK